MTNPAGKTITYAYDAVGQRQFLLDPNGARFTYSYDVAGRIHGLINPQGERTTFTYDNADRRTLKRLANATRASFTYDVAGQVTSLYNFRDTGSVISSFDYQYDDAGNRTSVAEANGDRVTWSYDDLSQLINEQRSGAITYSNTFTYDPVGNRTLKIQDGARTTYTYDDANQLGTSVIAAGTTTYTFDANGNQQLVTQPTGDRTTYTWDFENRNTQIFLSTGAINTFAYDPNGLRVVKQDSVGTTRFIWDGQNYLLETNAADATQVVYTIQPAIYGNHISQRRDNTTHWFHFDALGSTRQASTQDAIVSDTFVYDAWGSPIQQSVTTPIPFRWIGQLGYFFDADTKTYSVRHRTYDTSVSRWSSLDPIVSNYYDNRYQYATNSPVDRTDPSGMLGYWQCVSLNLKCEAASACCIAVVPIGAKIVCTEVCLLAIWKCIACLTISFGVETATCKVAWDCWCNASKEQCVPWDPNFLYC